MLKCYVIMLLCKRYEGYNMVNLSINLLLIMLYFVWNRLEIFCVIFILISRFIGVDIIDFVIIRMFLISIIITR